MMTWLIVVIFAVFAVFFMKISQFRHKTTIIFFILLILFLYTTISIVNAKNELDFSSSAGFFASMKVYTGWLANGFENLKTLGGYATKLDWASTNGTFADQNKDKKTIKK